MKNFRGPWNFRLYGLRLPAVVYRRLRLVAEVRDTTLPGDMWQSVLPTGRQRAQLGRFPVTRWYGRDERKPWSVA